VLVAPDSLRGPLIELIERAAAAREAGQSARIQLKMNSLVDQRCIEALYRASQAGVTIDINVRGICCLRPGLPGYQREHQRHLNRRPLPSSTRASTPSSSAMTRPSTSARPT